jgi:hypothetical protein
MLHPIIDCTRTLLIFQHRPDVKARTYSCTDTDTECLEPWSLANSAHSNSEAEQLIPTEYDLHESLRLATPPPPIIAELSKAKR